MGGGFLDYWVRGNAAQSPVESQSDDFCFLPISEDSAYSYSSEFGDLSVKPGSTGTSWLQVVSQVSDGQGISLAGGHPQVTGRNAVAVKIHETSAGILGDASVSLGTMNAIFRKSWEIWSRERRPELLTLSTISNDMDDLLFTGQRHCDALEEENLRGVTEERMTEVTGQNETIKETLGVALQALREAEQGISRLSRRDTDEEVLEFKVKLIETLPTQMEALIERINSLRIQPVQSEPASSERVSEIQGEVQPPIQVMAKVEAPVPEKKEAPLPRSKEGMRVVEEEVEGVKDLQKTDREACFGAIKAAPKDVQGVLKTSLYRLARRITKAADKKQGEARRKAQATPRYQEASAYLREGALNPKNGPAQDFVLRHVRF